MDAMIGAGLDRTDGKAKVGGVGRYAAEFSAPRLAHAVMVRSTIPRGRIVRIDRSAAERAPGVLAVMTSANAAKLPEGGRAAINPPAGRTLSLLQDAEVHYNGEPIAVVIAETFEQAVYGAALVNPQYEAGAAVLDFEQAKAKNYAPAKANRDPTDEHRGDVDGGMAAAEVRVDAVYTTPMEHHNPMEPHATVAAWDGDHLILHDATQYVSGVQEAVARTLGIAADRVRVVSPFVGGGFGCKGSTWSHVVLAAMAARHVGRPVKLVLARRQMFGPVGARPHTEQHIVLGARRDGTLTAIRHDVLASTSVMEDWVEPSAVVTRMLYSCPNSSTTHRLVKLNTGVPTFMRAPGEATGTFALESAMDELAAALKMDPLELRLRNYAETDPQTGHPWSSKSLRECYRAGAERFGWSRRSAAPRSMRTADGTLVGWGMATATYPVNRMPASALARLLPDGTAIVQSGTQDIGTGTYTVMTQVAAEALGLPAERVTFQLGDTTLPRAPVSGGSMSAASVSPAVWTACQNVRARLLQLAASDVDSPLHGAAAVDLTVQDGWVALRAHPDRRISVAEAIRRNGGHPIEARGDASPGKERGQFGMHSFGAVFAEVHVDPELGQLRVPRIVGSYGVGRRLNAKTARSQLMGGIVWGVSMALFEDSLFDTRIGRVMNASLSEYHVPVNADIGTVDVTFVDERDPYVNPLGVKGIGEIGITGVAAAVANAVFHATGLRIRDLPITLDKLMPRST